MLRTIIVAVSLVFATSALGNTAPDATSKSAQSVYSCACCQNCGGSATCCCSGGCCK